MKFKYKNLTPPPISAFSAKIKVWGFTCLLLGFITVLQSCTSIQEITPEAKKSEMLLQAKSLFKKSIEASAARKASTNPRDIDVSKLFPEWDKNGIKQNSKSQNVLGVFISITERDFWEADFIFDEDTPFMYIKKYSKQEETLTIYDGEGKFLKKGKCIDKTSRYYWFLTREMLSKQARIAQVGEAPDPNAPFFNGNNYSPEIDEVVVKGKAYDPIDDFLLNLPTGSLSFDELLKRFEEDVSRYNMAQDWLLGHGYVLYVGDFGGGGNRDITNNTTDPCIKGVVNNFLQNSHGINDIIQGAFSCNDDLNLNITNADIEDEGETNVVSDNRTPIQGSRYLQVDITIDTDQNKYSKEYIASTIIHEALHAYMDYIGKPSGNDTQHMSMANNYIDLMQNYLQKVYGMNGHDAAVLALGGLEKYDWFSNLLNSWSISSNDYWRTKQKFKDKTLGTYCN